MQLEDPCLCLKFYVRKKLDNHHNCMIKIYFAIKCTAYHDLIIDLWIQNCCKISFVINCVDH